MHGAATHQWSDRVQLLDAGPRLGHREERWRLGLAGHRHHGSHTQRVRRRSYHVRVYTEVRSENFLIYNGRIYIDRCWTDERICEILKTYKYVVFQERRERGGGVPVRRRGGILSGGGRGGEEGGGTPRTLWPPRRRPPASQATSASRSRHPHTVGKLHLESCTHWIYRVTYSFCCESPDAIERSNLELCLK